MPTRKRERRGGWPKRDRVSILLRLDPMVAETLSLQAAAYSMSRNQFIEYWLKLLAVLAGSRGQDAMNDVYEKFHRAVAELPESFDGSTSSATPAEQLFHAMLQASIRSDLVRKEKER